MKLETRRLGAALGSEVAGLDLASPVDGDTLDAIRALFVERSVLVFRDQDLSADAQLSFCSHFGQPERHLLRAFHLPGHEHVFVVSNRTRDGKPRGSIRAGQYWHSDCSYLPRPTLASFLHAREVPSYGGDTLFSSLFAAYDALSAPMRALLEGLQAEHDYTYAYETYFSRFPDRPPLTAQEIASLPPTLQPVVRVHPDSRRRALYISPGFTRRIDGLQLEESRALLQFLCTHLAQPEFIYRHRWCEGDLVMWDNRATVHKALADYDMNEPRHMHRTSVAGDAARGVSL